MKKNCAKPRMSNNSLFDHCLADSFLTRVTGGGYIWVYIYGHWVRIEDKTNSNTNTNGGNKNG